MAESKEEVKITSNRRRDACAYLDYDFSLNSTFSLLSRTDRFSFVSETFDFGDAA